MENFGDWSGGKHEVNLASTLSYIILLLVFPCNDVVLIFNIVCSAG